MKPDPSPQGPALPPAILRDWVLLLLLVAFAVGAAVLLRGSTQPVAVVVYAVAMLCLGTALYRLNRSTHVLAQAQFQTQSILDMAGMLKAPKGKRVNVEDMNPWR